MVTNAKHPRLVPAELLREDAAVFTEKIKKRTCRRAQTQVALMAPGSRAMNCGSPQTTWGNATTVLISPGPCRQTSSEMDAGVKEAVQSE